MPEPFVPCAVPWCIAGAEAHKLRCPIHRDFPNLRPYRKPPKRTWCTDREWNARFEPSALSADQLKMLIARAIDGAFQAHVARSA